MADSRRVLFSSTLSSTASRQGPADDACHVTGLHMTQDTRHLNDTRAQRMTRATSQVGT